MNRMCEIGRIWIALMIIGISLAATSAAADILADFEDGTLQGWEPIADPRTGNPFGGDLENVPAGGNPGGFMRAEDTVAGGGALVVGGPEAFQGDLSVYTEVRWDEYIYDNPSIAKAVTCYLIGSDNSMWKYTPPLGTLGEWRSQAIAFQESEWTQYHGTMAFADVMVDARLGFGMAVCTSAPPNFESGLDNIVLVSEPATDCNSNGIPDECDIDCGLGGGPCDTPGCGLSEDCNTNGVPDECEDDSDGDGLIDECDACPDSDMSEMIVIDGCDTGVANMMLDDGCTMADLIAECAAVVTTHGEFVSCVAHLTNEWKRDRLISGRDKGHIQRCAARADIPADGPAAAPLKCGSHVHGLPVNRSLSQTSPSR